MSNELFASSYLFPISYVSDVKYFSKKVSTFWEDILLIRHSVKTANKVNTILTELVDNCIEHAIDKESFFKFEIKIENDKVTIKVGNKVTIDQKENLVKYISEINYLLDNNPLELVNKFKSKMTEKSVGGVGLIRVVLENEIKLLLEKDEKDNDYTYISVTIDV